MSVSSDKADDVVQRLQSIGVKSSVIGEIIEEGNLLVDLDGVEHKIGKIDQDELFRILESE